LAGESSSVVNEDIELGILSFEQPGGLPDAFEAGQVAWQESKLIISSFSLYFLYCPPSLCFVAAGQYDLHSPPGQFGSRSSADAIVASGNEDCFLFLHINNRITWERLNN
jgi:hypothetical protein